MFFGEIEVRSIDAGSFWLDGGSMFGIVPRTMWEKKMVPDERHRLMFACNSLLVRAGGKTVVVETGNGTKWDAKLRNIYTFPENDPLTEALAREGVRPEQVDLVINTHLHFDHAGGNTRLRDGRAVPAFSNAKFVVQKDELAHALQPTEKDRASYYAHDFAPISEAGQWQFVEGDAEVLPGISVVKIPGHNLQIQGIQIRGGGKSLMYVSDLLPTRHHLPLPWIIAYDLYPLTTLETKRKWIAEFVKNGWIVVFGHDPDFPAATLHERDGKVVAERANLNA